MDYRIKVGLDFGTHQTKVCIERSENGTNYKEYEYLEWEEGIFTFPSVIQINKDHTLRFGSVEKSTCLYGKKLRPLNKPKLQAEPEEPVFHELEEPTCTKKDRFGNDVVYKLSELYGIDKSKRKPSKKEYSEYNDWKNNCDKIQEEYNEKLKVWELIEKFNKTNNTPKPQKPILPEEPVLSGFDYDYEYKKASQTDKERYSRYLDKKKNLEQRNYQEYKKKHQEWETLIKEIKVKNKELIDDYNESIKDHPMVFRHFKQACFAYEDYNWPFVIGAKELCIIYLTFTLLKIHQKENSVFDVIMGIPTGKDKFKEKQSLAMECIVKAFFLAENQFKYDLPKFLSTRYETLINSIKNLDKEYNPYNYSDYNLNYARILPEAFAALFTLTENGKIPNGMNMYIDIGGGTTDISFFTIDEKKPKIYSYESIPKGLNFILEENKVNVNSFDKKEFKNFTTKQLKERYKEYLKNVKEKVNRITQSLIEEATNINKRGEMINRLNKRPLIYSGGGSTEEKLREKYFAFNDIVQINEKLDITKFINSNLSNEQLFILATAYGLAKWNKYEDDINIASIKEFLSAAKEEYGNNQEGKKEDYNLSDT